MRLKILDTKSNEVRECLSDKDYTYWSTGGGACDCARVLAAFPENYATHKCCSGAKRYIIISIDKPPEDLDIQDALIDLNYNYPVKTLKKHGILRPNF
jgi:hypothetical protein